MWIFNLLESASTEGAKTNNWLMYVLLGVVVLFLIGSTVMSGKSRKKQVAAEEAKRNSMQVGFKVTTIGGICGTVVEINEEENTFVLETGKEGSGNFIKFDKQAIYKVEDPNAEKPLEEEPKSEESTEGNSEDKTEVFDGMSDKEETDETEKADEEKKD